MGKKANKENQIKEKLNYELYTVREAAEYLRVHPDTIRSWIKSNQIKYLLLDTVSKRKAYRIDKKELDKVIKVG